MSEFLSKLFSSDFMPHGACYLWRPEIVWLHATSDTLIALSSTALDSGRKLQQRGGTWICDRGSTHIRFAERILVDEYARWGVNHTPHPEAGAAREEQREHRPDALHARLDLGARGPHQRTDGEDIASCAGAGEVVAFDVAAERGDLVGVRAQRSARDTRARCCGRGG